MSAAKHVVVLGAGAGGLAAAVDLARSGYRVTVVETAESVGGKMNQVVVQGQGIDTGPTVFTMKWIFDALFNDAGGDLDAALGQRALGTLAKHWWPGGARLDLDANINVSAANIAAFSDAANAQGYRAFCRDSAAIHNTLRDTFMAAQKPNPLSLAARVGFGKLGALLQTRPHQTLWRALGSYFTDPRLQQLFGRYATYVGSSPLAAPATLMLIAHVEQTGVWVLPGGMSSLAQALRRLAEAHGAAFRCNCKVMRVMTHNKQVSGVELETGERITADAVIFNGDVAALANGLLGDASRRAVGSVPPTGRGLSAITWTGMVDPGDFRLGYHNVFFDHQYPEEFEAIFKRGKRVDRPTVYVCAQDRSNGHTPKGRERALILINAPANGDRQEWSEPMLQDAWQATTSVLGRAGLKLALEDGAVNRSPHFYHQRYPASGGSLYGRASHGMFSSFSRPGARSRLGGLYLCGGSVHPGPGVPMATLSGRLAARAVIEDMSA